jgi:hypothetical protein
MHQNKKPEDNDTPSFISNLYADVMEAFAGEKRNIIKIYDTKGKIEYLTQNIYDLLGYDGKL